MSWWRGSSMKMLAEGGHTLNPGRLLRQIMSAVVSNYETADDPALTVGEANAKAGNTRDLIWLLAILLPSMYIAGSAVMVYELYTHPSWSAAAYPLYLPAVMLWGVYMALVPVVAMYMNLHLPDAPVAVREALVEVGWLWVGSPVCATDLALVYFGQAWMVIAMICFLGLLIAALIAFWVWLVRTYTK